jgi:hypothetical protein
MEEALNNKQFESSSKRCGYDHLGGKDLRAKAE